MSTRANVGVGENVAIAGFIIQGTGSENVVLRGLGPSLPFANKLPDPFLRLYNSNGSVIAQNNNWKDTQQSQISGTGLAPTKDLEAAIRVSLAPGTYSVILSGVGGGSGIGAVEVYENTYQGTKLVNLSTRANVGLGDSVAITGLIIKGSDWRSILFRGLGPTLPVTNKLQNPFLKLYNSAGTLLLQNNNWKETQQSQIAATGTAPTNDLESAMLAGLSPGSYTVILSGVGGGTTGVGSVELYDLGPVSAPPPTPTPQPQRLLWQDTREGIASVGRPNPQIGGGPSTPQVVKTSNLLSPSAPGLITVHFNAYAVGVCQSCGPNSPPSGSWTAYSRILNEFGTVVATSYTGLMSHYNWSGARLYVQIMADSQAYYPNNDNVHVTYFDVYGP